MTTHDQLIKLGFVLNGKTYLHKIYMDDIKVNVKRKKDKEQISIFSKIYNGKIDDVEAVKEILDRIYDV